MLQARNDQMVVYKKKKKKPSWRNVVNSLVDPNQLAYEVGLGAIRGAGELAKQAFTGIVSAFSAKGASKAEIKALVAPLAKTLSYTSRKPQFTKAEGGLMIEHIENIALVSSGHTEYLVSSTLFQWLKGIASQFEEYQIKTWYAWNPICPATTAGQVMLAFDYDPNDTGVGQYAQAVDYFNTADHCVSAIWAPAAISPQRSGWLKTGNSGDVRLYSPGRLHLNVTDHQSGFLTVKYQVALRKPQPADLDNAVVFTGTTTNTTDTFGNAVLAEGDTSLVSSITDTTLTVSASPGYKIVTWSTSASVAAFTYAAGAGARTLGTRTGTGATYGMCVNPGVATTLTITLGTAPGSAIPWKLSIQQAVSNPLGFTWT